MNTYPVLSAVVRRPLSLVLLWVWVLLVAAILLMGCSRVAPVVKIGLVGPFEGENRAIGYDAIYSARLAIRQANENGGVGGYRVALVALDDFGEPEIAAENAEALVIDPSVMAVLGHWLPETTRAADPIYKQAGLPFIAAGDPPFGPVSPALLSDDFRQAYAEVTPFDETAGPFAGSTYDALNLVLAAMAESAMRYGSIDRPGLDKALEQLKYEGLTGTVYQNN